MNQLEAFVENLERQLGWRYQDCSEAAATPSSILLAVLNAVAAAKAHLHDEEAADKATGERT